MDHAPAFGFLCAFRAWVGGYIFPSSGQILPERTYLTCAQRNTRSRRLVGDSQSFGNVLVELPVTTDLSSYSVGDVVQVEGLCTGPGQPVGEPVVVASTLTDQTSGAHIGG